MMPERLEEICETVNLIHTKVLNSEQDRVRYLQQLVDLELELNGQTCLEILVKDHLVEIRLEILSRTLSR